MRNVGAKLYFAANPKKIFYIINQTKIDWMLCNVVWLVGRMVLDREIVLFVVSPAAARGVLQTLFVIRSFVNNLSKMSRLPIVLMKTDNVGIGIIV